MTNDTPPRDHIGAIPIAGDLAKKPASGLAAMAPRHAPSTPPARPVKPPRRRRWGRRLAVTLAVGLLLYTLAGYILVPYLFHTVLPGLASRQTGRSVAIGGASFNPFTLSLTLRNTIVGPDPDGPADQADPILSCGWLDVYFEAISLLNWQLNVRLLNINDLFIHGQRYADNNINLASLLPAKGSGATDHYSFAAIPIPFSLSNITITNSRILFDDRKNGHTYSIEQMRLALPYLANRRGDRGLLPRLIGRLTSRSGSETQFIRPEFSATVNGSPVQLAGETRLTDAGTETSLNVALQALNLADIWGALPVGALLVMDKGIADLDLRLIFTTSQDKAPTLRLQGTARLHDLWLRNQQGQEVAKIPRATLTGSVFPMTREYHFSELVLEQPALHIERDPAGNWSPAVGGPARPAAEAPVFEMERLKVIDGRVSVVDRQVTGGFAMTWSEIQCTAESLANTPRQAGKFSLTARTGERGGLSLQGDLTLSPLTAIGMLVFKDFDLQGLSPYVSLTDGYSLKGGRLESLETKFNWQQEPGVKSNLSFNDVRLQGRGLALDRQGRTILELPEFTITNGSLLVPEKRLDFGELHTNRTRLLLEWDTAGALAWGLPLLGKDSGWQANMTALTVLEAQLQLRRAAQPTPLDLTMTEVQISATGLGQPASPGTVTTSAQFQGGGAISLNGPLTLHPWSTTLTCRLDGLPLPGLQPLLAGWLVPEITAGQLVADGTLRLPDWAFFGSATVHDFAAGLNGTTMLSWRQATTKDCQLTLTPFALYIQDLTVATPFLSWTVDGEGKTLRRFLKERKTPAAETLRIEHISVQDGTLHYHDRTATPPFSLVLVDLTGSATELNDQPDNRINLTWQGMIAEASGLGEEPRRGSAKATATLEVSGLAGLFDPGPFFDLRLHAVGVKLSPLSPYLEADLGYLVKGGNLELTSALHRKDENLTVDNTLAITDFLLGDPVAGPSRLPLTVALLTDEGGVIATDIPVAGKMDDHSFSMRRALMKGIRNLLIRTTASPFTLLASFFPDQTVQDFVPFPYGRSDLSTENRKNLQGLADILRKRPRLRLTIKGFADASGDQEALVAQQKTENLKKRLVQETHQTEELSATDGKEGIMPLPEGRGTSDGGPLIQEIGLTVDDRALATLARQRAAEVRRYFEVTPGLAPDRFREADDTGLAPNGGLGRSGNRVQFSLDSMTP